MVQDDDSGLPGCDICQHPASTLSDEGVFLCTTHEAEARCLKEAAHIIEWSLTDAGRDALSSYAAAPLERTA